MHDLKEIRKDFDSFRKSIEKRSIDIDFNKLKDLDINNRGLIQKKESLEKEKTPTIKEMNSGLFSYFGRIGNWFDENL